MCECVRKCSKAHSKKSLRIMIRERERETKETDPKGPFARNLINVARVLPVEDGQHAQLSS